MQQLRPEFLRQYEPGEVCPVFGLEETDLIPEVPIQTVSTGTIICGVPVLTVWIEIGRAHV